MKVNVNFTDRLVVFTFIFLCVVLLIIGERINVKKLDPCKIGDEHVDAYVKMCGKAEVHSYKRYSRIVFVKDGFECLKGVVFSNLSMEESVECLCAEGERRYGDEMIIRKIYPCEYSP